MPIILLFEVMDKELSLEVIAAASIGLGLAAFFSGRKLPLLAIPFGLVILMFFVLFDSEVRSPFVGPDIVREAGIEYVRYGYLLFGFGAALSIAGPVEWIVRRILRRNGS